WQVGEPREREGESQLVYPFSAGSTTFDGVVSQRMEGKVLRKRLEEYRPKKHRPPLFGLLHYERCRLVLQPLAIFGEKGPEHLMISNENVDRAALLKTLKF